MADSGLGIPLRLDEGSELISVLFAVGLWGITCVQTYGHPLFIVFLPYSLIDMSGSFILFSLSFLYGCFQNRCNEH